MHRSLYKYVSIDRLRKILIDHKVRFTQPGDFNDPFELVPRLAVPKGHEPQGQVSYEFNLRTPRRALEVDHTKIDEDRCSDHHFRELRQALDRKIGISESVEDMEIFDHVGTLCR